MHVMLRLLIHQAQHIGRLVHPDRLAVRHFIIFHSVRTLRLPETYLKHRLELAFKCAQRRRITVDAEGLAAGVRHTGNRDKSKR